MKLEELCEQVKTMGAELKSLKEHVEDVGFVQANDSSALSKTIDRIDALELEMKKEFGGLRQTLARIEMLLSNKN
jgi:hypothetical protein